MSMDAFEELRTGGGLSCAEGKETAMTESMKDDQFEAVEDEGWHWQLDGTARRCGNPDCRGEFWLIRRRHHCRPCGKVYCSACCTVTLGNGIRQCLRCSEKANPALPTFLPATTRNVGVRAVKIEKLVTTLLEQSASYSTIGLPQLLSSGPPRKIFKIKSEIGLGNFGRVFEAQDDRVGDNVAIKVIEMRPTTQPDQIAREVVNHQKAINAHLLRSKERHPFPRLYDVFENKGGFFKPQAVWIVMELVSGETLSDFLRIEYPVPTDGHFSTTAPELAHLMPAGAQDRKNARKRQRSIQTLDLTEMDQPVQDKAAGGRKSRGISDERTVADYCRQLLMAILRVHQAGLIFRDLKADNVMVESDNFTEKRLLRLIDFGSSIPLPNGTSEEEMDNKVIEDTMLVGSMPYMPPESWDLQYSQKSDIWGFGCLAHEICEGVSPFEFVPYKVAELMADMREYNSKLSSKDDVTEETLNDSRQECEMTVSDVRSKLRTLLASCQVLMENKKLPKASKDPSASILCWSPELKEFIGMKHVFIF